jgi:menaquinone-dependent protoporphyrinogen oxidase
VRVLVTAASKYGATGEIAQTIGNVLEERGVETSVVRPDEITAIDGFDAVVLGSAVYAGRWMKSAKDLVDRFAEALAGRPVWLFSSGPVGDPPKPDEDPVDVAEIVEATKARGHQVFSGKVVRKQLSFPEKAIVVALRVPDGDFRDWEQIRDWASGIAEALAEEPRR